MPKEYHDLEGQACLDFRLQLEIKLFAKYLPGGAAGNQQDVPGH